MITITYTPLLKPTRTTGTTRGTEGTGTPGITRITGSLDSTITLSIGGSGDPGDGWDPG
ncbi:hypothetical protein [Streptomyces clavuligerus]|uniref:Uncharacterized protein n=1 Tax=Streptomyces clavuligerus TaxID=1901 RepID=B5GY69_STRCL|nr:hypothetical protein [Streptomyces clavuligerus]EDY51276.1 hypothetical protein SSCG_04256 [Streptomyces clavuligerus]EFG07806.1 Hypothetical protein SCLAV_2734 [Streptomyces clavuligerus]MBY6303988.1 hypothetical protein [Streptomyces clavuligerus]QPL64045.1 hypothetical protein I3J04_15010 [Streptomyces clavuligerus]QPL70073.1 hypothetical protein I3J05_15020 [Streptomyces clavuligerus]